VVLTPWVNMHALKGREVAQVEEASLEKAMLANGKRPTKQTHICESEAI
jgi:hypothetical protein